jgi:hypothetical protein
MFFFQKRLIVFAERKKACQKKNPNFLLKVFKKLNQCGTHRFRQWHRVETQPVFRYIQLAHWLY